MLELYSSRKAPQPLGTVSFDQIEAMAKEKLKEYGGMIVEVCVDENIAETHHKGAFMYAGGSAGTNSTYRANLRAFEKFGIIPRMLVNATNRNLEVCTCLTTICACMILILF